MQLFIYNYWRHVLAQENATTHVDLLGALWQANTGHAEIRAGESHWQVDGRREQDA